MKWKSESLFLFWTDTCCLHEQSVETFLSCCDNIMPQIHCTFFTKSVVLVAYYAADPLHILYEVCGFGRKEISSCVCSWLIFDSPYKTLCHYHWWLNSLLLRLMYSLHVRQSFVVFNCYGQSLRLLNSMCACKTISRMKYCTTFRQTVPEKSTTRGNRRYISLPDR